MKAGDVVTYEGKKWQIVKIARKNDVLAGWPLLAPLNDPLGKRWWVNPAKISKETERQGELK